MPVALIDSKNASSRARYSDQRERVLHAAIEALRHSEDSRGVTCNKNKVVKKYTTNGLFTFVCLGCGMLVMLHSIERQETPMTAMNLLCLHAHTLDDHKAHALYLAGGLWHDPLAVLDDSLSLPTVALGSADIYGEVVRTPAQITRRLAVQALSSSFLALESQGVIILRNNVESCADLV